jgi:anti-sigma regulatory factor (Ser/Thr protein kinase)
MAAADRRAPSAVLDDWRIPLTREAARAARHHVRELAERNGYGDRADSVETAAGETLANAVLHGSGDKVHVLVTTTGRTLRVEVHDEGTGRIGKAATGLTAETGRGMRMVDEVTDRSGIYQDRHGTTAWFEVSIP